MRHDLEEVRDAIAVAASRLGISGVVIAKAVGGDQECLNAVLRAEAEFEAKNILKGDVFENKRTGRLFFCADDTRVSDDCGTMVRLMTR